MMMMMVVVVVVVVVISTHVYNAFIIYYVSVRRQKQRLTFGIFDEHPAAGGGRLALARLVDREHAEVILALLDQVRNVEYGRRRRHLVDADPVVRVGVLLLDVVAEDAAAAVRMRLLPRQRHEVAADLLRLRLARRVRLICAYTTLLTGAKIPGVGILTPENM